MLRNLAAEPDAFITDEIFRALYGRAEAAFGKLKRIDLGALAGEARTNVNTRMGDAVVQDLLIDGLNYIDLSSPEAAERAAQLARGNGEAAAGQP